MAVVPARRTAGRQAAEITGYATPVQPTTRHIDYCLHLIGMLQHYGVTPIAVLDGAPLPVRWLQSAGQGCLRSSGGRTRTLQDLAMSCHLNTATTLLCPYPQASRGSVYAEQYCGGQRRCCLARMLEITTGPRL